MALLFTSLVGCDRVTVESSDTKDAERSEVMLNEASAQLGIPNIKNFREKKILKDIYEMRDKEIITYTYIHSEYTGKLIFVGQSVGYPIPYCTQYTSSEKMLWVKPANSIYNDSVDNRDYSREKMPQAEPNGLFMPTSADGTWVMMYDPATKVTKPCYFEPKITTLPFKLPDDSPALQK